MDIVFVAEEEQEEQEDYDEEVYQRIMRGLLAGLCYLLNNLPTRTDRVTLPSQIHHRLATYGPTRSRPNEKEISDLFPCHPWRMRRLRLRMKTWRWCMSVFQSCDPLGKVQASFQLESKS